MSRGNDDLPASPVSELASLTAQVNEMYIEFRRAGFDHKQAAYFTMATITGNPGPAPPGADEPDAG